MLFCLYNQKVAFINDEVMMARERRKGRFMVSGDVKVERGIAY